MSEQQAEEGSMASDMRALLQSAEGADVTLVVGDSQLPAHSHVLAARSPVFAAALRHDMRENRSRRIEITDVREEVLRQLLLFMYSDETPQLASVAAELLSAADKYNMPLLKKRCERQMARDLSVDNAANAAALAVLHCCSQLQNAAVQYMASHPEVLATDGWARVLWDSAEAAVEISRQLAGSAYRPPPWLTTVKKVTGASSTDPQVPETRIISEELKRDMAQRLMEAACNGRTRTVWALLTAGAPTDAHDGSRNTALHLAAFKGHASVVKCLLAAGVDVNAVNSSRQTPLHQAAQQSDADVIWMLVASGARVDAQNSSGKTPLHIAAEWKGDSATRILCEEEVLITGATAVRSLVLAGARKDIVDVQGKTPQSAAIPPPPPRTPYL